MKAMIAAAFALTAASSLTAQTATSTTISGFQYSTPTPGSWTYAATPGGSEASFFDANSRPQLFVRCTRANRQVTIAKPATAAAAFFALWTSSQARILPASYNPATYRLSATVGGFDPLLDAIAFSRGRFAVSVTGATALIVPAWEEPARVIEDCRV